MDEGLSAFVDESRSLLDDMEAALLALEERPQDEQTMHAVFRAAHTIKGSAGIFGLDDIVAFTHVVESVLDEVRAGHRRLDSAMSSALLGCCDHLRERVQALTEGREPDAEAHGRGQAWLERLGGPSAAAAAGPKAAAAAAAVDTATRWHLSVSFGADVFRAGFDPLSFLRYLGTRGTLVRVVPLAEAVPPLSQLAPADECHLAFEIALDSTEGAEALEQVFEFVRDSSRVTVLRADSPPVAWQALLAERPALREAVQRALSACDVAWADSSSHGEPPSATSDTPGAPGPVRTAADGAGLRVDAAKLDRMINLVGELLIAAAGASLLARQRRDKALMQATASVSRLMEEVRDSALSLRMVPIGGTFNRFQRVVRDLGRDLGKDVALQLSGAETEMDKAVAERLADPLTHLVRNAIDHGLENGAQRLASGKPARGTVHLSARHEAGWVVIDVADDGRGLSRERILQAAVSRGLVAADAALSDAEVYQLIFQPGFSTASTVSTVSGRGVGMDVVARDIEALRGSISLHTEMGRGTTVSLRLPLTLSIIDGFLFGVGGAAYVVPLAVVVECIALDARLDDGRDWLDLRGRVLPLLRLRRLYDMPGKPARRQNVVVVRHGEQQVGLVVDQLQGELQTVIRPLGRLFQGVPGVSGFTILASGAVALLLDVPGLLAQNAAADPSLHAATLRHPSPPDRSRSPTHAPA